MKPQYCSLWRVSSVTKGRRGLFYKSTHLELAWSERNIFTTWKKQWTKTVDLIQHSARKKSGTVSSASDLDWLVLRETVSHWRTEQRQGFEDETHPVVHHSSLLHRVDEYGASKWVHSQVQDFELFCVVKRRILNQSFSMSFLFSPWTFATMYLSKLVQHQSPTYKNKELHESDWSILSKSHSVSGLIILHIHSIH